MSPLQLGRLESVALRDAWPHEAVDFTPWLASPENLTLLAESLGLSELQLVETEHPVGGFKLDMLCVDGEDRVIIENQIAETDHRHLGQLLAYAAGVGARKVIWLAKSFRPEHAAALQFLNENTVEELSFFGVKVELWRIGDSAAAPRFEVIVRPNGWVKAGREQAAAAANAAPAAQLQLRFWQALTAYLQKNPLPVQLAQPRARYAINGSIGRGGFGLNPTAKVAERCLGVEVYLSSESAKEHFRALRGKRTEIETALGFELDWQELQNRTACRIASWLPDASIADEANWPKYIEWVHSRLKDMDRVFRPLVQRLP
jgi:hypothetical protein